MPTDVQIRQFVLSDREALLAFLRTAYPDEPRRSEAAFWNWHFLDTPRAATDELPLWIVKSGERIVGQLATLPVELKAGAKSLRAIWLIDFIVDQALRGRGLGKQLVLTARKSYPTMLSLGGTVQSIAVFRRLNWADLGHIRRYQKLLYPGNDLQKAASLRPLGTLVNFCYSPFRPRLSASAKDDNLTVREVFEFDDSFNALWQTASTQWPCAVVRDAASLRWQFGKQPGKRYVVLGLFEQEQLRGYAVLFFRKAEPGRKPAKASIADLCYSADASSAVIDDLLRAALRLALERRAGSLVTDVLDARVEERLKRLGFWRIRTAPQFMVSATEERDLIYEPRNWFLTRGDSDVSIFEHPNL
ncbi:MAG TPA: GNAT family N-acetyltransferase [Pyrinomonadaceae bacterium]|jgi:GNAT superfamily N-acetyltransferase